MGKRREPAQIARDRRRIADLYLQGKLQAEIADEIGVDQSTVSRDLRALHREWLRLALTDFDKAKARELAKIDKLEREYWVAWQRSCEDAETVVQKAVETAGAIRKEATKTEKGQAGDPRFLQGVQWCIERRCKIMGVDAPDKYEQSGEVNIRVTYDGTDSPPPPPTSEAS